MGADNPPLRDDDISTSQGGSTGPKMGDGADATDSAGGDADGTDRADDADSDDASDDADSDGTDRADDASDDADSDGMDSVGDDADGTDR